MVKRQVSIQVSNKVWKMLWTKGRKLDLGSLSSESELDSAIFENSLESSKFCENLAETQVFFFWAEDLAEV